MVSKIFNNIFILLILKHQMIMLKNKIVISFTFENTYTLKYSSGCKNQSSAD